MRVEISRVLMTADAFGGVWTYALELARVLGSRGIETTIATMGTPPSEHQMRAALEIEGLDVVCSAFDLEWMDDPWEDVAAAGVWLQELAACLAPDVVHLNGYAHASLPFDVPVVIVGHSCLVSWARAIPGAIEAHKLDEYRDHVTPGLRAAAHVVAPSAAMLDAIQEHYGPLTNTSVIPNGRQADRFGPGRKEPFVFTGGRLWDRAKNAEAVAAVATRIPWPVAMAGAGGTSPRGVRLLGRLSDQEIASWLSRASIFALPARYEPFGLLPLEAAMSGCALVLGAIPSLQEVWEEAADYVDPDDREALRGTLLALMSAPARLDSRAKAARDHARRYSADRMGDAYVELYRAVVARFPRRGGFACVS